MSDHEDLGLDEPLADDPIAEPVDDAWSPVMGTPPPDADPGEPTDLLPPHETFDDVTPPPEPDPGGELGDAPPPPPAGELPPELPADPVDLSVDGGDEAPMPPVQGDDAGAPPAPTGDIDLDGGPPLAPDSGAAPEGQSPVPAMGDPTGAPVDGAPDGQSPVPTMGGPTEGTPDGAPTTEPDPAGAPMPPTGETNPDDPAPPDAGNPEPGTVDGVPVAPGEERLTAAAVTGWFLDEVDANDPARERMIDLVEQAAADGSITVEELEAAFLEAGFPSEPTDGSDGTLGTVIADAAGPRTALVAIDGEGVGLYRVRDHGDIIELESVRTGAVHAADRGDVAEAWRSSGARVISTTSTTTEVIEVPAAEPAAEAKKAVAEDDGGSGLRNLLLAGGVLLPLAGGGTYLATRKLR